MKPANEQPRHRDGRDEMNLADFPISALQRTQKSDGDGRKLDRMEFTATRYDPATRQRQPQRVTLTSTARDGLPTPADEHVILALLYVHKHAGDFADATVPFAPAQLFEIMGWAPNGRSYTRLRDVLRRLKSLTIRYENAWWDAAGRGYEEEVATGIVAAYRIARQVSGPRRPGAALLSWVTWTPQFHDSLKAGNLKRLNLEVFFRLQTPTAQRMYRFLDKRFYTTPTLSMDLTEFACGHVGLTEVSNVAILKRRLAPAIEELERIGFIQPADAAGRYQKVKAGQWRIHFQAASVSPLRRGGEGPEVRGEEREMQAKSTKRQAEEPPHPHPLSPQEQSGASTHAAQLAHEFYRQWNPGAAAQPGARDLEQAEALLRDRTAEEASAVLTCLVQVTRQRWPLCRSLSGAVLKYLPDALRLHQQQTHRAAGRLAAEQARQEQRRQQTGQQADSRQMQDVWDGLPDDERQAIEREVRRRLGGKAPVAFLRRLCLEELARRIG